METFIPSFDGLKLYLHAEAAPDCRAAAVIVHGLCEHQGRYDYLAAAFHKAGISTYRFDHRGHGRSEGEKAHYSDFNELLDDTNTVVDLAVSENPGLPVFLVGHSMGGFTVSLYGVKYPEKGLRGIVTSGALTAGNDNQVLAIPKGQDPHTRLPNGLGSGVCSVPEVVDWYGKDPYNGKSFTTGLCYALSDGLEWFRSKIGEFHYPVLMLHGEKDGLVSVKDTYNFFDKVSSADKQMKIYGGLFHEIFNEYCRDEVIDDALRWITARI
ncbi:MAG: alpha/beta hydrolase [Provencibacterium sp.]|nr:alpha/beta hydrolase [Provencibacterium sp.]